jgi:hypothetical protein
VTTVLVGEEHNEVRVDAPYPSLVAITNRAVDEWYYQGLPAAIPGEAFGKYRVKPIMCIFAVLYYIGEPNGARGRFDSWFWLVHVLSLAGFRST